MVTHAQDEGSVQPAPHMVYMTVEEHDDLTRRTVEESFRSGRRAGRDEVIMALRRLGRDDMAEQVKAELRRTGDGQ